MSSVEEQVPPGEPLPLSVRPAIQPQQQSIQVVQHRRTMTQREISYRCEWCSHERTEVRYPGPLPRYCCPDCKDLAQNSIAAQRMKAMRER